jgi:hypothetical protein
MALELLDVGVLFPVLDAEKFPKQGLLASVEIGVNRRPLIRMLGAPEGVITSSSFEIAYD